MNKRQRKKLVKKYELDRVSARTLDNTIRTFKLDVDTTARAIEAVQQSIIKWVEDAARTMSAFGLSIQQVAVALAPLAEIVVRLPRWIPRPESRGSEPWPEPDLPADHAAVLVDLARAHDEATFKELARSVGITTEDLDALWTGTRQRLGLQ